MKSIYIGIDPGKDGGFAIIFEQEPRIIVRPWDEKDFIDHMTEVSQTISMNGYRASTCLEKVAAMPGQGVSSMFTFGKSVGFIEGVLQTLEIPYQPIVPRKWKAEFSLTKDKGKSVEVASKLFPHVDLLRSPRCRKPSDGMAEALLMAEYARRKL